LRRIAGYRYDRALTIRLGEYEEAMLRRLMGIWGCSASEAIRNCVVYTFSKWAAKVDKLDEESLLKALQAALGGITEK
jgi:hypothetical protein